MKFAAQANRLKALEAQLAAHNTKIKVVGGLPRPGDEGPRPDPKWANVLAEARAASAAKAKEEAAAKEAQFAGKSAAEISAIVRKAYVNMP
jgi:hypothetical protein